MTEVEILRQKVSELEGLLTKALPVVRLALYRNLTARIEAALGIEPVPEVSKDRGINVIK